MDKVSPPTGMRDVLPDDFFLRDELIGHIRRVYESYGYAPIDTPVMENIEVLANKAGGETEQLVFKVLKRGASLARALEAGGGDLADMAMRFDLTVPLCRYYATNVGKLPRVFRRYHIAPVWRAERAQHGRFREFYQCDVDVLGERSNLAECEVILATWDAMRALEVPEPFVKLSDRRIMPPVLRAMGLDEAQVNKAMISIDKLDKIPPAEVLKESEGYLDADQRGKLAELLADIATDAKLDFAVESLGAWGRRCAAELEPLFANLRAIRQTVADAGGPPVDLRFWPSMVRGMGYYTGPIFEVWVADKNARFSLAGGGRYDQMVGKFLGQEVPACGFSIGFERILTLMKERRTAASRPTRAVVYVVPRDEAVVGTALRAGRLLREAGLAAEVASPGAKMKACFDHATKWQIPWVLLVGRDGAEERYELATVATGERVKDAWDALLVRIRGS